MAKQLSMFSFEETALPLFEEHRADWLARARAVARQLGAHRDITIDDVRRVCPPPSSVDPRVMGAVFKTSEWRLLDHVSSLRGACHHRPVGLFRLIDRDHD